MYTLPPLKSVCKHFAYKTNIKFTLSVNMTKIQQSILKQQSGSSSSSVVLFFLLLISFNQLLFHILPLFLFLLFLSNQSPSSIWRNYCYPTHQLYIVNIVVYIFWMRSSSYNGTKLHWHCLQSQLIHNDVDQFWKKFCKKKKKKTT